MTSALDPAQQVQGHAVERIARFAAAIVETLRTERFLQTLMEGLRTFLPFDNFIVYSFRQGFSAELVHSSLDLDYLGRQMQPYTDGLFLLDPFYIADVAGVGRGLVSLDDVAPEAFAESEFFLTFYSGVDVLDELHYVIPIAPGRSIHLFIERELPNPKFTDAEVRILRIIAPLVLGASTQHWAWRDESLRQTRVSPIDSSGGVDGVIRNMGGGCLTRREAEVIGLLLRGHSSKLIARNLSISEGTVTNHKRNVYEKLGIHSQSQLFSLFLTTLAA